MLQLNQKLLKKIGAVALAGTMIGTMFTGCSLTNDQPETITSSMSEEVKNELPSDYNYYNLSENPIIDFKYRTKYYKVTKMIKFINVLPLRYASVKGLKGDLEKINDNKINFDENNIKLIEYDENSALLQTYADGYKFDFIASARNENEGYYIGFVNLNIVCSDLNNIVAYSKNDENFIIVYNSERGDLMILDNALYLGFNNNTVSFAKLDDTKNVYDFDILNLSESKQAINNINISKNYVSYISEDKVYNCIDLLSCNKTTKKLGKENLWIELSNNQLIFVKKDGSEILYDNSYEIESGSFKDDYVVLRLNSSKDCYYFDKRLDAVYKLPEFNKILQNDITKGYIKYLSEDEIVYFTDLDSGEIHQINNVTNLGKYTIYNLGNGPEKIKSCSIIKDENGKTIKRVDGKYGEVREVFESTYIQSLYYLQTDDNYYQYGEAVIRNLDNDEKNVSYYYLWSTPIKNIFIASYEPGNIFLVNEKGQALTDDYNYDIYLAKTYDSEDGNKIYKYCLCNKNDENNCYDYEYVFIDSKGKLIDKNSNSYKKAIKH